MTTPLRELMQQELNTSFWHLAEQLTTTAPRHVRVSSVDGFVVHVWNVQVHHPINPADTPTLIFGDTGAIPGMWPYPWPSVEDGGRRWVYDAPELARVPLSDGPEALIAAYEAACARPDPLDGISPEHLAAMGVPA